MDQKQDLIQQLMRHTGVSEADARAALDAAGNDLLDAVVWLEQQGKISHASVGSSHSRPDAPPPPEFTYEAPPSPKKKRRRWRLLHWLWRLVTENQLVCHRNAMEFHVPLAVLIALLCLAWYALLLLLLLALLLGWRCHFIGPQLGHKRVNDVMDHICDANDDLHQRWKDKKKH